MTTAIAPEPTGIPGTVYLLHFEERYGHAQHYIGWSGDTNGRLRGHLRGRSRQPLLMAVHDAGIKIGLARLWEGADRHFERVLHRRRKAKQFCPVCRGEVTFDEAFAALHAEAAGREVAP